MAKTVQTGTEKGVKLIEWHQLELKIDRVAEHVDQEHVDQEHIDGTLESTKSIPICGLATLLHNCLC